MISKNFYRILKLFFNEILTDIDVCVNYEAMTPYDGGYSMKAELDENGYPVYQHSNKFEVSYGFIDG